MKIFKKYTLTFTLAALTCTSLLHCADTTSQTPSTSKLQSVINYVKNIRKPLTPQEKLAQYITQADVDGFKQAYDAFLQSDATAEERAAMVQELTTNATKIKQQLLDNLSCEPIHATMLVKGIAQTFAGGIFLTTAAYFAMLDYKFLTLNDADKLDTWKKTSLWGKIGKTEPFTSIFRSYFAIIEPIAENISAINETIFIDTPSILTGTLLSTYIMKKGLQNWKNGWDYKDYLKRQIKNIDKINEFIQAHIIQQ